MRHETQRKPDTRLLGFTFVQPNLRGHSRYFSHTLLTARFSVPHPTLTDLKERVQQIGNLSVLRNLLTDAVKVESLDDFVKRLDELQP